MIQLAMEEEITGSFHHGLTVQAAAVSVVVLMVLVPEHSVSVVHVVEHGRVALGLAVTLEQMTKQDE